MKFSENQNLGNYSKAITIFAMSATILLSSIFSSLIVTLVSTGHLFWNDIQLHHMNVKGAAETLFDKLIF